MTQEIQLSSQVTVQRQSKLLESLDLAGLDSCGARTQVVGNQAFAGAHVTANMPQDISDGNASLPREEQMVDAQAGLLFQAQRSHVGAEITAQRLVPPNGLGLVPVEEMDPTDCLFGDLDQVKVTFHTRARSGPDDVFRSVELKKKGEDKEQVSDIERQKQVTQKFAEIKHLLHLGKQTPASYSITWHTIEIFPKDQEIQAYDLYKEEDVKRLLESHGGDASPDNVKKVIKELNAIRDILKSKEYLGVETEKFPTLMQDYMGDVNGPAPFGIATRELLNAANDAKSHVFLGTMVKRGLVKENKRRFRSSTYTLTPKGKEALKQMHQMRILQRIILYKCNQALQLNQQYLKSFETRDPSVNPEEGKMKAKLQENIATLSQAMDEFQHANTFIMDFLLMELDGNASLRRFKYDETGQLERDPQTQRVTFDPTVFTGRDLVLGDIDPKAEGITAQGEQKDRLVDEKHHDYVDLVANQMVSDMDQAIVHANHPSVFSRDWPKFWKKSNPHELTLDEKHFTAMAGSQLYDLLSEKDSLDPVRRRKTDFLNRHGVSEIPQTDKAVDLLLHAVTDGEGCRRYKDNPLIKEVLEDALKMYREVKNHPRFAWAPPEDYNEAANSLKGLDKKTSDLILETMRNQGKVPSEPPKPPAPPPSSGPRHIWRV